MRYININDIKLPDNWERRAQRVIEELVNAPDATERKKIIERRASLWAELKQALDELSGGKCWYCESQQYRSDNAVDHFRPKSKVAECNDHSGYWWLAFDWRNYRLSCTFCNSRRNDVKKGFTGGKEAHFPIIDESNRARQELDDITLEQPFLLDPTNLDDPTLLWFYKEGRAVPRFAKDEDEHKYGRAEVSIKLYHLNHTDIEEQRRILYNKISDLVELANDALDDATKASNPVDKAKATKLFRFAARQLQEMVTSKSQYSAASRAFLQTFIVLDENGQDKNEWIRTLLSSAN